MKRIALLLVLCFLCVNFVFSVDFGLLAEQKFEWEQDLAETKTFSWSPTFTPWFSWDSGEGISVYLSGHFPLKYTKIIDDDIDDDKDNWGKPAFKFELTRSSFSYTARQFSFEAGRVIYSDIMGVTAAGLFDGIRLQVPLFIGDFSAGLFYTGLLYKESAKIMMTATDGSNYAEPWDEKFKYYFASRRILFAGRFDLPVMEYNNFSLEAIVQFDCNGEEDDRLHSQYFQGLMEIFTQGKIGIAGGAFIETMQSKVGDDDDFTLAIGALGVIRIDLPTPINDGLKFTSKFCSGPWNDTFTTYTPVSTQSQGQVFQEPFSDIWVNKLNYDVRILPSLFMETALSYFVKASTTPDDDGKKIMYGGEFWGSLAFQPVNDIRATLGGGMFLPKLGNFFPDDTKPMWKISAGVYISF